MSTITDDKTIESITFITSKPLLSRLDVFPFLTLYAFTIGAYLNVTEEWSSILCMIAILLAFVAHVSVLLVGYWHVTFRVKMAYNTHTIDEILQTFSKFSSTRYSEGIRFVQDEYEGALTRYKMWYTFYDKKLDAAKLQHQAMVKNYRNNPNAIPPGPFIPPEPPTAPQIGNPVVLFNNTVLEACIIPHKHSGNPIISRIEYDIADSTRIQYSIHGLLTPKEVLKNRIYNSESKIVLSGPQLYPPFHIAIHHSQYTMDPHAKDTIGFQPRQYPDNDKLAQYLTHHYTPTTPTPSDEILRDVMGINKSGKNVKGGISSQHKYRPISIAKNSTTLHELARTASSTVSSSYRLLQYGFNSLTVPIPGFITLFIENAMSPFFVFQIACILLWCLDEYWYYSLFTLAMVVILECTVVYKRQSHLTQMLGEKPALPFVHVYRRFETATKTSNGFNSVLETDLENNEPLGGWVLTPTKQLVPGDLVAMPVYNDSAQINTVFGSPSQSNDNENSTDNDDENTNTVASISFSSVEFIDKSVRPTLFSTEIPCDMLLLSGSCVCDESMLSGESVPQVKEDLISLQTAHDDAVSSGIFNSSNNDQNDDELQQNLDEKVHKRYQLYSGTKLIGIQRNYQHSFFAKINNKASAQTTAKPQIKTRSKASIDDIDDDMNAAADSSDVENNDQDEALLLADKKQNFLTLTSRPPLPPGTDVILCRVLRTGFSTTQGSLVRTILTAADNVLVDKEALYFILALLVCAIISAYFVLIEGLADATRSRYKLLLNVITILTSVVPPELPMQLSMAVNNALASLAKTQVFCTDPNRLPSSGQIDICCFDKTGTLTADEFLLACALTPMNGLNSSHQNDAKKDKTVSDIGNNGYIIMKLDNDDGEDEEFVDSDDVDEDGDKSLDLKMLPIDTRLVLGCAQELAMLQLPPKKQLPTEENVSAKKKKQQTQRIVGDPMEAAGFSRAGFQFFQRQPQQGGVRDDSNINNKMFFEAQPVTFDNQQHKYIAQPSLPAELSKKMRFDAEILHRFTFQSQLQRMSSIVAISPPQSRRPTTEFQQYLDANDQMNWLGTTLPKELRENASKTLLRVVVKGSPEMIYNSLHPLYRPDFHEYTQQHKALARQGLRVLALAWKPVYVDTKTHLICNMPDVTIHSEHDANSMGSIDAYNDWLKKFPRGTFQQFCTMLKVPQRDQCEQGLFFAGIVGFNSPLKTQSQEVINHLHESNHKTIMITGDHLLTAIAVAKDLNIAKENCYLLSKQFTNDIGSPISPTSPGGGADASGFKLVWKDEFENYVKDFDPKDKLFNDIQTKTVQNISLCINGDALSAVIEQYPDVMPLLCSNVSVFARTLPYQKELILKFLREFNNGTQKCLMCGDGTNDVGALTHANIGIALSSIDTDSVEQLTAQQEKLKEMNKNPIVKRLLENAQKLREKGFGPQAETIEKQAHDIYKRVQQSKLGSMMSEMDDAGGDDDPTNVKLGDASLAASFSAKHGSIRCVLDVIRQGRCALATTGQMYQILALQCLVAAYSLSALYFKGVRQSESQMTISGLVAAVMSMMLANAQPLQKISSRRPNARIFSFYNITTIALQFIVHLGILMYMVNYAMEFTDIAILKQTQLEDDLLSTATAAATEAVGEAAAATTKYVPTVLNTVVFIMSTAMSAITILANYVGFPFMTPLTLTSLLKLILGTIALCCALSMEMMPELNEMLEMTPMPNEDFSFALTTAILLDLGLCVAIGLGTKLLFGIVTIDDLTKPLPKDVMRSSNTNTLTAPAKKGDNSKNKNNTKAVTSNKKKD